jgi:tetratricopeptide (TPR) repeat protein
MGNRTHALQIFEELANADPNDAQALAAAAELHKEAGSLEKALRTADALVNLQGTRATADDLLELNKSLELYESAVNAYSTKGDMSLLMTAAGVLHKIEEEEANTSADTGTEAAHYQSPEIPETNGEIQSIENAATIGIPDIIDLLDCLKNMTESLPQEDRGGYLQSKYPASLESVIDSLKNLTTMGDIDESRL